MPAERPGDPVTETLNSAVLNSPDGLLVGNGEVDFHQTQGSYGLPSPNSPSGVLNYPGQESHDLFDNINDEESVAYSESSSNENHTTSYQVVNESLISDRNSNDIITPGQGNKRAQEYSSDEEQTYKAKRYATTQNSTSNTPHSEQQINKLSNNAKLPFELTPASPIHDLTMNQNNNNLGSGETTPSLREISVCLRTVNNERPFIDPRQSMELLKQWPYYNQVVPDSFVVPGIGNCMILKMLANDEIENNMMIAGSYKLGETWVNCRKISDPTEDIKYIRVGPLNENLLKEEIFRNIKFDSNASLQSLEWLHSHGNSTSNSVGKYLKLKITGNVPKYVTVGYVRYPASPHMPVVLRCKNCLLFGHSDTTCKRPHSKCINCSSTECSKYELDSKGVLVPKTCQKNPYCFMCDSDHKPTSLNCPTTVAAKNYHRKQYLEGKDLRTINQNLRSYEHLKNLNQDTPEEMQQYSQVNQSLQHRPRVNPLDLKNNTSEFPALKNRFEVLAEEQLQYAPEENSYREVMNRSPERGTKTQRSPKRKERRTHMDQLPHGQDPFQEAPSPSLVALQGAIAKTNQETTPAKKMESKTRTTSKIPPQQVHSSVRTSTPIIPPTLNQPAKHPPNSSRPTPPTDTPQAYQNQETPTILSLIMEAISLGMQGYNFVQVLTKLLPRIHLYLTSVLIH